MCIKTPPTGTCSPSFSSSFQSHPPMEALPLPPSPFLPPPSLRLLRKHPGRPPTTSIVAPATDITAGALRRRPPPPSNCNSTSVSYAAAGVARSRRRLLGLQCRTARVDGEGRLSEWGAPPAGEGDPQRLLLNWPEKMKVLGLVALIMCICNADRVVMSVAVVPLAAKYGWSTSFLGIVQSSFLWGYLLSSAVGGALSDRHGGKSVMAWGAGLWSLATLLTPWAANHSTAMLIAVRALFGLAEGVALPSMNVILSGWFPAHERASAVGFSMAGFHAGNVIGFLAAPLLMATAGISGPFKLFAALGFTWILVCASTMARDPPSSDRIRLSQAGKKMNRSTGGDDRRLPSLRHLLSKMPTWAIILANIANNWGYFVLLSWMPVYFRTVFNVNLKQAAWFSAIPWGLMAVSGYIAGLISDYLIKSGHSVTRVRKIMQSIGFVGPGLALLCLNSAGTPLEASLFLTAALSLSSFSQAGFFLNMQDIAPRCAGLLHGIANSAGTVAAIVSTMGTGYFVQRLGSFQAFLTLTSALYFLTAIFWNLFATGEQVFH